MRGIDHGTGLGLVGGGTSIYWRPMPHRAQQSRRDSMGGESKAEAGPDVVQWIAAIAARQDRDAFAALFDHYAPRIKGLVVRMGGTPDLGEELAQEALLAVWRKSAYFDPARASASTWIFTIVRNLRIDRLRRQQRATLHDLDLTLDLVDPERPDEIVSAAELDRRVRNALVQLSEEQVRVVKLSFFEDKPHEEIARILQIPLGTVKSRLRLAMGRLRKLLGDLT